jgi:hypothetical protein
LRGKAADRRHAEVLLCGHEDARQRIIGGTSDEVQQLHGSRQRGCVGAVEHEDSQVAGSQLGARARARARVARLSQPLRRSGIKFAQDQSRIRLACMEGRPCCA